MLHDLEHVSHSDMSLLKSLPRMDCRGCGVRVSAGRDGQRDKMLPEYVRAVTATFCSSH